MWELQGGGTAASWQARGAARVQVSNVAVELLAVEAGQVASPSTPGGEGSDGGAYVYVHSGNDAIIRCVLRAGVSRLFSLSVWAALSRILYGASNKWSRNQGKERWWQAASRAA